MKATKLLLANLLLLIGLPGAFRPAQTDQLNGAWRLSESSGTTVMLTLSDTYLIETRYNAAQYLSTRGGPYRQEGSTLSVLVEFDTQDSSRIGQTEAYSMALRNGQLVVSNPAGNQTFSRVAETPTPLTGLWRITGRANEAGQLTTMQRGPRKTIKLLTGSRFQWVALNPQTKQFSGTGGGTYTLKDGKYTETIDFFSRDNSRVGNSLTFGADVNGKEWHHTGQSSTGGSVNEIWTRER